MVNRPSKSDCPQLTLESNLQSFFYDQLFEINRNSNGPLPNETIYYSSLVMEKFSESKHYFEKVGGKKREKILGLKLLKSAHFPRERQKRELKDIGDTALLLCGFFSDSLNRKLIDNRYYQEIGQSAYLRLNDLTPKAYNRVDFYELLSNSFSQLSMMITIMSQNIFENSLEHSPFFILNHLTE